MATMMVSGYILTSLMRGTLVIGHEGSYQGNLATNICAGSAVLHCVSTDQYAETMGGEEE